MAGVLPSTNKILLSLAFFNGRVNYMLSAICGHGGISLRQDR